MAYFFYLLIPRLYAKTVVFSLQLIFAESPMVQALIRSDVTRYLEFRSVNRLLFFNPDGIDDRGTPTVAAASTRSSEPSCLRPNSNPPLLIKVGSFKPYPDGSRCLYRVGKSFRLESSLLLKSACWLAFWSGVQLLRLPIGRNPREMAWILQFQAWTSLLILMMKVVAVEIVVISVVHTNIFFVVQITTHFPAKTS